MKLSAIVPVHNGGAGLRRCLEAVLAGTRVPDELIVVDDGSTDGSGEAARALGARVIRLDDGPNGPAAARNRGAAAATGEVILFFDADVVVHPDTVARMERYLSDEPAVDALFGSYDDNPPARGMVTRYKNLEHHYVHQQGRREAGTFWAGCGAIRRAVFSHSGGFDERYARPSIEDIELGVRLRQAGYRIWLCPDVQVVHLKRWTFAGLLRADIRDRAIPWSRLIVAQGRGLPDDLNLGWRSRVSALMAWLPVLAWSLAGVAHLMGVSSLLGVGFAWWAVLVTGLGLLGLGWLNRDLYRFFAQRAGLAFAVGGAALHWLYFIYSSATLAVVLAFSLLRPRPSKGQSQTGLGESR
jgi:glycosyltransferase involved in cell wall biosynthesis